MSRINFLILLVITTIYLVNGQTITRQFDFGGTTRVYTLHIPSQYDAAGAPLVVVLHGMGDSGQGMMRVGFNDLADTAGFFVAYPEALNDPVLMTTAWNVGLNPFNNIPDVGFLNAMMDSIIDAYPIDISRIYFTGFSMGAFMTYRMACTTGDRIAAVAPVGGTMPTLPCDFNGTMPLMHVHGTADQTVPYEPAVIYGVVNSIGADSSMRYWVYHNHCSLVPDSTRIPDIAPDGFTVDLFTYSGCDNQSEVRLYRINGADHPETWLGPNNDLYLTDEIWHFFKNKRKVQSTHISGIKPEGTILVYPNPANNMVEITIPGQSQGWVAVYDISGKLLQQKPYDPESVKIDLQPCKPGAYLLRFLNDRVRYDALIIRQ